MHDVIVPCVTAAGVDVGMCSCSKIVCALQRKRGGSLAPDGPEVVTVGVRYHFDCVGTYPVKAVWVSF